MRRYSIAGHTIQISGEGLESLPGFGFFQLEELVEEPLLVIEAEAGLQDWDVSPVFSSEFEETSYNLCVRDETCLFRMKRPDGCCLLAEIRREGSAFRAAIDRTGVFDSASLAYVCWLLYGVAALSRQTVSIHSSTVIHRGKAILFLGESGTGKSTHTRLWLNHIPDTQLLNDDSPFIRIETDGSVRAHGSPWSGKTPCYKNIHTPVAAFVRLSQAPYNRIRRLTGVEAIAALLPSCPFTFAYDKRLSESIYSVLSHTLQQLPVYHLECLPDADAARLVHSKLIV